MNIAVKYCGGCNSKFDRSAALTKLKDLFPMHIFLPYDCGEQCSILLLVCGCERACISNDYSHYEKVFCLTSPRSFLQVSKYLSSLTYHTEESLPASKPKVLAAGECAFLTRTFTAEDAILFGELTGDTNKLHFDPEFASHTAFHRTVLPGILVSSMLSSILGTKLPGDGTVLYSEDIRYRKPCFVGDTVTARIALVSAREQGTCYVATFAGLCKNQSEDVLVTATIREILDKKLFKLEEDNSNEKY